MRTFIKSKYYLLKGLLLLSFFTIGYILSSSDILSILYICVFHSANLALVCYAYKHKLLFPLSTGLLYNGAMTNPNAFIPIDWALQDLSPISIDYIVHAAVPNSDFGYYLFFVLSSFVLFINLVLWVKLLIKQKNNNASNNLSIREYKIEPNNHLIKFFQSKYSLLVSLIIGSGLFILLHIGASYLEVLSNANLVFTVVQTIITVYICPFLFYWLMGAYLYPKIKNKKSAIILAITVRAGILVLTVLFAYLISAENYRHVFETCIFCYSPLAFESHFALGIISKPILKMMLLSVALSPVSVLLVVIFNKIYEASKNKR